MNEQTKGSRRVSGIPKLSRIPLPTNSGTLRSIRPSPSRERLQADSGLNIARLRRPSEDPFVKPLASRTRSVLENEVYDERPLDSPRRMRSLNRLSLSVETLTNELPENVGNGLHSDGTSRKAPRPSLSDRTIETLSHIPPSPSPGRRKSGFADSVRSPSRQSSSSYQTGSLRALKSPNLDQQTWQRSASSSNRLSTVTNNANELEDSVEIDNKETQVTTPYRPATVSGKSKFTGRKPTKARPSLTQAFPGLSGLNSDMGNSPLSVRKTRKHSSPMSSSLASPTSTTMSRTSQRTSITSDLNPPDQLTKENIETRKASKSSTALRESIAKAEAARKAALKKDANKVSQNPFDEAISNDPFNQLPKAESTEVILRNRTTTARASGHLNISALGLRELPNEVINMYNFDQDNNSDWYENVDLVKLIAADNELQSLPDVAFPAIDPIDQDKEDIDEESGQFGGLEYIDLHGNILASLPQGLQRLQRLKILNLSKNRLNMEAIGVIFSVETLTELKLAENDLHGVMSSDLSQLKKLEVLDLHGNELTRLPDEISELTALRVLNVANNQLSELPMAAIQKLPLMELNLRKNRLRGHLFPDFFNRHDTLQILGLTANNLELICSGDALELPNLQQLFMEENRIKQLPNISSWKSLLTLAAEGNSISAIPEGMASLKNLKHADFTGNDLRVVDDKVGLMESLVTLRIANNPLRERKMLTMDTDELKRELCNRCEEPREQAQEEDGSEQTEFTLAPESPSASSNSWKIKQGGVLDLTSINLYEMEPSDLEPLATNSNIRRLYIQRNNFEVFPAAALSLIAHGLVDLDLSNNPLDSAKFLTSSLSLPNLQNLTLTATKLTSLEPLLTHLSAPSLSFLDVSNNRLTGSLPALRSKFKNLLTFLVSDNKIGTLEYDAVKGLQVLDVSNNNIDFLPPRIGLLGVDDVKPSMTALRRFEVAGNIFRVPRWQVVSKGTESVLDFLKNRITDDEMEQWADRQ